MQYRYKASLFNWIRVQSWKALLRSRSQFFGRTEPRATFLIKAAPDASFRKAKNKSLIFVLSTHEFSSIFLK